MKNIVHRPRITQIGVMHRDLVRDGGDVSALDLRIVEIVEVVQDRDLVSVGEQLLDKVRPDESGAARHENFHCASVRRKRWPGKGEERRSSPHCRADASPAARGLASDACNGGRKGCPLGSHQGSRLRFHRRLCIWSHATYMTYVSLSRRIQCAPKIPRGDRAVRPPSLADGVQLLRLRQLFLAKGLGVTFPHTVVVDWPDIEPAEIEEEQHLDCPAANPAHCREASDDLFVTHPVERDARRDRPVQRFRGEILDGYGLAPRKPRGAKRFVRRGDDQLWRKPFPPRIEGSHPAEDRRRRFAAQLLISNRLGQRVEWSNEFPRPHGEGTGLRNERCKFRITCGKMLLGP